MKNNIQPIYAKAKTMAVLLDIGVSTFLGLVDQKILPAGKKFQKTHTSTTVWNIAEVCKKIESINSMDEVETDPFDQAVLNGSGN